jgi:hypothetical protein
VRRFPIDAHGVIDAALADLASDQRMVSNREPICRSLSSSCNSGRPAERIDKINPSAIDAPLSFGSFAQCASVTSSSIVLNHPGVGSNHPRSDFQLPARFAARL